MSCLSLGNCACIYFHSLSLSGWLQAVAEDRKKAYCSCCEEKLYAHYKDLVRHSNTHKHKQRLNAANKKSSTAFSKGMTDLLVNILLVLVNIFLLHRCRFKGKADCFRDLLYFCFFCFQ